METPPEAVPETLPEAIPEPPLAAAPGYAAMSARALATLIVCGVLGTALLIGVKREAIGDFIRFEIDAKEATAGADQALRENKIDPATYMHATTVTYTFDGYNNEYLRRTIGIAAANSVYRDQVPSAFWTVRYFRDSQNEEYMVVLRPDGSLHSLHHTLDENAPGANLSKEEAQARAETYLRDQKKTDLSAWNLVETRTERKPARTDHVFEWEQKISLDPASGGEGAHIRMQLQVQGDEVSGYRIFIKIPETWRDVESRTTPLQLAQSFGRVICFSAILIDVLVIFLRRLKQPEFADVPWRKLALWSSWVLIAAIVTFANRTPQLLLNYQTTWPLKIFFVILFISLLFVTALYLVLAVLLLQVFPGFSWMQRIRPRTHSFMGRHADPVLRGRDLRGNFWRGSAGGTEPPPGIIFALAAAAAHVGSRRSRRPRWTQPRGGRNR